MLIKISGKNKGKSGNLAGIARFQYIDSVCQHRDLVSEKYLYKSDISVNNKVLDSFDPQNAVETNSMDNWVN